MKNFFLISTTGSGNPLDHHRHSQHKPAVAPITPVMPTASRTTPPGRRPATSSSQTHRVRPSTSEKMNLSPHLTDEHEDRGYDAEKVISFRAGGSACEDNTSGCSESKKNAQGTNKAEGRCRVPISSMPTRHMTRHVTWVTHYQVSSTSSVLGL